MEGGTEKICLICGINMNKRPRHDRYNYVHQSQKKGGKAAASRGSESFSESGSDSEDSSSGGKSKKKIVKRKAPVAAASGRQTRNQNPKAFASSLCKTLKLPATPDEPFLRIFSAADYCSDCMVKVKDIHDSQKELEKIQARLAELKVDIEIDLSKHLQKIPFMKTMHRTDVYERYKEDINLILDYNDADKKKGGSDEDEVEVDTKNQSSASRFKRSRSENEPRSREREAKKQKVVYKEDSEEEDVSEVKRTKSTGRKGSTKKEEVEWKEEEKFEASSIRSRSGDETC